jgi:hypothetical protein
MKNENSGKVNQGIEKAHIFCLLGTMAIRAGDSERRIELFKRAEEAIPVQQSPDLEVISLVSPFLLVPLPSHRRCLIDIRMGL